MIKFAGYNCNIEWSGYPDRSLCMTLVSGGEQIAIATTSMPESNVELAHVLIKNWSENKGILEALVDAGVVVDTGRLCYNGFVAANICKIESVNTHVNKNINYYSQNLAYYNDDGSLFCVIDTTEYCKGSWITIDIGGKIINHMKKPKLSDNSINKSMIQRGLWLSGRESRIIENIGEWCGFYANTLYQL